MFDNLGYLLVNIAIQRLFQGGFSPFQLLAIVGTVVFDIPGRVPATSVQFTFRCQIVAEARDKVGNLDHGGLLFFYTLRASLSTVSIARFIGWASSRSFRRLKSFSYSRFTAPAKIASATLRKRPGSTSAMK